MAVWQHEMSRVFLDRVCRSADHKWIEETIQIVSAKVCHISCLVSTFSDSIVVCSISLELTTPKNTRSL